MQRVSSEVSKPLIGWFGGSATKPKNMNIRIIVSAERRRQRKKIRILKCFHLRNSINNELIQLHGCARMLGKAHSALVTALRKRIYLLRSGRFLPKQTTTLLQCSSSSANSRRVMNASFERSNAMPMGMFKYRSPFDSKPSHCASKPSAHCWLVFKFEAE